MDYQMNFTVKGLHNSCIVELLKNDLLKLTGVKEVQIGINRLSVIFDASLISPNQITLVMRKLGIKTQSG
ncbi:MAG: hypothetical protein A4E53_01849 [Pelotomaculum sp. PtaB.Bin104]|nr:MAG: hypothetical protein A4E53_01849 [Pelotomaculum sp. PtaB.Bin104]